MTTANGWFAARPSGTEDVYKLYAESFRGPEHLAAIQDQAKQIIAAAIGWSSATLATWTLARGIGVLP